jgi:hypothetical protein
MKILCLDCNRRIRPRTCKEEEEERRIEVCMSCSDWESCVTAVKRTAKEIIGFEKKRQWKGWYDQECVKATQEKNAAYQRTIEERCTRARHEEYHNIRHETRRIHNKNKKKRISGEAD